jgi:CRP-like cAMP-binding protein
VEIAASVPPTVASAETAEVAVEVLAERLTAAELDALVAAVPDETLAHLVVAGMRQLRRRLVRTGATASGRSARAAKGRGASALERAARELAAELGGAGGGEDGGGSL